MSTEVLGALGFILALAVLVVLVCKGMHLAYCAIITVMNMCDLDFMEGYKPCFWTSVVCTGLGTLAVLIVLIIFPGLAV